MNTLFYGFWEYWKLYHKVTFDGVNRLILINPGETLIDIQRDVYSAWKQWAKTETNTKFLQPLATVGGEPTVAGQRLDVTYFLINGWRIKPAPGSYTLSLIGNIFDIDGGEIKVDADVVDGNPNNITINVNTSVIVRQVDASGGASGGLTSEESAALFNIEDRVLLIESLFQSPITATLENIQASQLTDIQMKLLELWKIHGLDTDNPMAVSKQGRLVDEISQVFTESDGIITVSRY